MKALYSIIIALIFSGSLFSQENDKIVSAFIEDENTISVKFAGEVDEDHHLKIELYNDSDRITKVPFRVSTTEYSIKTNIKLDFTKKDK